MEVKHTISVEGSWDAKSVLGIRYTVRNVSRLKLVYGRRWGWSPVIACCRFKVSGETAHLMSLCVR